MLDFSRAAHEDYAITSTPLAKPVTRHAFETLVATGGVSAPTMPHVGSVLRPMPARLYPVVDRAAIWGASGRLGRGALVHWRMISITPSPTNGGRPASARKATALKP